MDSTSIRVIFLIDHGSLQYTPVISERPSNARARAGTLKRNHQQFDPMSKAVLAIVPSGLLGGLGRAQLKRSNGADIQPARLPWFGYARSSGSLTAES